MTELGDMTQSRLGRCLGQIGLVVVDFSDSLALRFRSQVCLLGRSFY